MLAAKRSLGNLRGAARAQCAGSGPAVPSLPGHLHHNNTRTLVSAVLLSRDQFEKKTVKQLQQELGERGLSTKGRKSALVDRLLENVSRNPPPAHALSRASASSPIQSASFSSSSLTSASTSESRSPPGDISKAPQVSSESIETHSPSPVSAGSQPPTMGEHDESSGTSKKGSKTVLTAAPGLVVDKAADDKLAQTAEAVPGGAIAMPNSTYEAVQLPTLAADRYEIDLMIPSFPDSFQNPPDHDPHSQPFTMHPSWLTSKVHTVDGDVEGVHHQGSPHKPTDDPDSRTLEPQKVFQYATDDTLIQEALANLGIKVQKASKKANQKTDSILSALTKDAGLVFGKAAEITDGGAAKFEFHDRNLNDHERTGLYALLGLVGGGFLLGGFGAGGKKQKEAEKH